MKLEALYIIKCKDQINAKFSIEFRSFSGNLLGAALYIILYEFFFNFRVKEKLEQKKAEKERLEKEVL